MTARQRIAATVITVMGVVLAASYLWLADMVPALTGAVAAGIGTSWLSGTRRGGATVGRNR
jgi:hypothetical protein